MRCKHCGSFCAEPLPGKLTAAEAFEVIARMADLGLKWVILLGGDPLTRNKVSVSDDA